jgi:DNA-binding CsgD family transcriptional regulator
MGQTIRQQIRTPRHKRSEYGRKVELIDRRREVWKHRARGLSLRAIAAEMGITLDMVWRDLRAAQDEWGEISESPEVLRQQLLETHRAILGGLLTSFDREIQQGGQSTETYDRDGNLVSRQLKSSPNVQLAAEAGRTVMRAAQLMGLIANGPDAEANAQGAQQTNITLIAPAADGAQFELRAEKLKAEAIDVTTAAQQLPEETSPADLDPPPEPIAAQLASDGPTAATEPTDGQ